MILHTKVWRLNSNCIFGYKINTFINEEYNRNIIKQKESAMIFEQTKNPNKKLNPMDKQEKYSIK